VFGYDVHDTGGVTGAGAGENAAKDLGVGTGASAPLGEDDDTTAARVVVVLPLGAGVAAKSGVDAGAKGAGDAGPLERQLLLASIPFCEQQSVPVGVALGFPSAIHGGGEAPPPSVPGGTHAAPAAWTWGTTFATIMRVTSVNKIPSKSPVNQFINI
jgi:hypothetical protein